MMPSATVVSSRRGACTSSRTIPVDRGIDPRDRLEKLEQLYHRRFHAQCGSPNFLISVPLRICPLGAHSDHQAGLVTGLTINRYVSLLARSSQSPRAEVWSSHFNETKTAELLQIPDATKGDWGNYLRGAVRALFANGENPRSGFSGVIHGDMPIGGLSSSAAVSIAYLKALEYVHDRSSRPHDTIALVRAVENGYLGLHNGILDQSVIMSGKKGTLSCIDCSSQTITNLTQQPADVPWEIMVIYSGLSRQLTATPFNQRVAECKEAAQTLLKLAGKPFSDSSILGDVEESSFDTFKDKLNDTLRRRATHFFTERTRVRTGKELWTQGKMADFGRLVTASGESSIRNFESGSPALIDLYEIMAGIGGVLGTRFCGGGFQGCALALIDSRHREEVIESLHDKYTTRHPELRDLYSIHLCEPADSVTVEVIG